MNQELPTCPAFGLCGGCQYQDLTYDEELRLKTIRMREVLRTDITLQDTKFLPAIPSPKLSHYRNRIDLKLLKRRSGDIHIGFSPIERGPVVEIETCPLAMEQIANFIPQLRQEAIAKLPQKYNMANLVVRCGDAEAVRWGGIGRRSTKLEETEYLYTNIGNKRIYYSLDTFFQANLSILPTLRDVLRALPCWSQSAIFYDLYGGVGLFSLMLHDLVSKAIDIEENLQSIRLARWNMMQNHIGNMEVVEGRVEDILPDILQQTRTDTNIVMVDPPRAGLSPNALDLLNGIPQVKHLLYLSCSLESLARDLHGLIAGGWSIQHIQPFDFFPRTRHLETLTYMTK